MSTIDYFEKNGYLVLQNALSADQCGDLVQHMFELKSKGLLEQDEQCPLSDAVYGDPVFDDILQKFAEPLGKQVGKKLLPTYTYARIYRTGEVLKKHKDRPACEISATMTLGYNAKNVWPIYFDEEKEISVDLEPGELAVYKGCEVLHWRKAFKGEWHVQVFFHYVDANGPYKHHVKDGRTSYGVQKQLNVVSPSGENKSKLKINKSREEPVVEEAPEKLLKVQNPIYNAVVIPPNDTSFPGYFGINSENLPQLMFTKKECERILKLTVDAYPTTASVGGTMENSKIAKSIRSADIYNIDVTEETRWIFDKVSTIVSLANTVHFGYDITGILHSLQLIHYQSEQEVQGHYDWHIDAGGGNPSTRKISFTAQLSDPNDYEGCELIINNHGNELIGTKERGSIHLFPSYMPHRVTPVTKGERYALVIWIHGSTRFK